MTGYIAVFNGFVQNCKYCNQQIMSKFEVINVNATGVKVKLMWFSDFSPNLRFIESQMILIIASGKDRKLGSQFDIFAVTLCPLEV